MVATNTNGPGKTLQGIHVQPRRTIQVKKSTEFPVITVECIPKANFRSSRLKLSPTLRLYASGLKLIHKLLVHNAPRNVGVAWGPIFSSVSKDQLAVFLVHLIQKPRTQPLDYHQRIRIHHLQTKQIVLVARNMELISSVSETEGERGLSK